MVESSLAPKWPSLVPFCGMDHQKSNFSLISDTLSVGGCWGQPMLLFLKLVDETQMSNPRDNVARDILSKFSIHLPLRSVYFRSFLYETPCTIIKLLVYCRLKKYGHEREKNVVFFQGLFYVLNQKFLKKLLILFFFPLSLLRIENCCNQAKTCNLHKKRRN